MKTKPVVSKIESGQLRGSCHGDVVSFKGVPYAAPTSGSNRFMAPQPVPPWIGIREARHLGDRCPQDREDYADTPAFSWYGQTGNFGEDCCVLNVFTPSLQLNARRPVMVYIHGGGYITGGGGGHVLDGSNLAAFGDVVVVTLNHRLNIFGHANFSYLNTDLFQDAANAGQLDLIQALRWVQRNISAFGGDPLNVTLFGQSGGGSKIMVLLGMPAARGLFHRVINMSGAAGLKVTASADTELYAKTILRTLGIGKDCLYRLHDVSADALLIARRKVYEALKIDGARPVIDGKHVVASAMEPGGIELHSSVPMMLGTTDAEATFYFRNDHRNFAVDERQVEARISAQFGLDGNGVKALIAAYREDDPKRTATDVLVALASDVRFRIPMIRAAEAKSKSGQAPVYLYNFAWRSPIEGGVYRATHTIDLPFAFGNTAMATSLLGNGPEPVKISKSLMAAFVAFARDGNPSTSLTPGWQPYDPVSRNTMKIDTICQSINDFHGRDRIAASQLCIGLRDREILFTHSQSANLY